MLVPVTSYILLSAKHVASLFVMAARETPRRLWNAGLLLVLLLQLNAASDQPPVQVVTKSTGATPTDYFTTANSGEDLAFTKGITSLTAVKKDVGEEQSELPVRTTIAPLNITPVSSAPAQNRDTTQVAEKKGDTSTATVLFSKLVKLKTSADADSTDKPTTDENLMFDTKDIVGTNLLPLKEDDGDDEYNFEKEYEMTSKSKDTLGRADTLPESSNKEPADVDYESDTNDYEFKTDEDSHNEDSHFFLHLILVGLLVILVYIAYHNKRKIFLLVQKRRWRDSLCSKNVGYRRLNQNVNEAMPSLKRTNNYTF